MEEVSTLPVQVLSMMIGVFAMVCVVFVYGIRSVTPPASHFQAFDDNTSVDKKSKKHVKKKKQTQNGPTKSPRDLTDKGHQSKATTKPGSPVVKEPAKLTKKKTKQSESAATTTSKTSKSPKAVEADYADAGWTVVSKKEPKQNKQPASPKAVESSPKPSQQDSIPKGDAEAPPKSGKKADTTTSKETKTSNGQGETNATSTQNTGDISPRVAVKSSPKKTKTKDNQDVKSKEQKGGEKPQGKKKGDAGEKTSVQTSGKPSAKGKEEKESPSSKGKEKQASPKKEKTPDDEWIVVKTSDKKGSPKPAETSSGKSQDEDRTLSSKGKGHEKQSLPKEEEVDNGWIEVKGSSSPATKKKSSPKPKASPKKKESSPQPSKADDSQTVPSHEPQLQAVKEKVLEALPSQTPAEGGEDAKKGKKKGKKGPTSPEPKVNGHVKNTVPENDVKDIPATADTSPKTAATKATEKQSKDSKDTKESTSPSEESTKKGKKKQKNKPSTPASPTEEKKETTPSEGNATKEQAKNTVIEKKEAKSSSPTKIQEPKAKIQEPKAGVDESKGTEVTAGAEKEKPKDSWQEAKPQKKKKKVRKDV